MPRAPVRARRDERESLVLRLQPPRRSRDQPRPGGAEGMTERQRSALQVQFAHVDLADFFAPEFLVRERLRMHGHEVA